MRDSLIQQLIDMAEGISEIFGASDHSSVLIHETLDFIEQSMVVGESGHWSLPKMNEVKSTDVLHALWSVLGEEHPVEAVLQYAESSASALRFETDLGTELWAAAAMEYPEELLIALSDGEPFTPESFGAPAVIDGSPRTPEHMTALLGSAFCNVVFLSFCDAALGNEIGVEARRPLLKLLIQNFVFPIGFTHGGRTILVPVRG